jgi:bZIP-type transcription factor MBZ1
MGTVRGGWDAEKVRKVLEGKAVVRVVDVEPVSVGGGASTIGITEERQVGLSAGAVGASAGAGAGAGPGKCAAKACTVVTDILEESMRSLSLGKKA